MPQTTLFRKVPLLAELPRAQLDFLASSLEIVELEAGVILFREGDTGDSLYIVLGGSLEVVLGMGTVDERVLAVHGAGDFVGEMSLLIPDRARTASVRTLRAARLWKMTRADFDALLAREPSLSTTLVRTLTRRLDATTMAGFRDLQEKNRQLQQAFDELKAAQAGLVEKERLERELQVAAEIQRSILPQELPSIPGFDFGALIQPARLVGGDFYDVFPMAGGQIGVVIGDVADKGIPSAIFMARAHALIMAEADHGGEPGEILRRVNAHLLRLGQGDQFVTVLFGRLDARRGDFRYARAGHELPLLLDGRGRLQPVPHGRGQAIGFLEDLVLEENSLALRPGSTLLLFTDGLTDGRDPHGQVFGHSRVAALLRRQRGRPAQQACDALLESLRSFQAEAPQEDDITLVVLQAA